MAIPSIPALGKAAIGTAIGAATGVATAKATQLLTGTRNKLANTDKNSPNVLSKAAEKLSPVARLEYPQGLTVPKSKNNGPFMEICAFEYGRRQLFERATTTPLFKIRLQLPGNLSQSFGAQYDNTPSILGAVGSELGGTAGAVGAAGLGGALGKAGGAGARALSPAMAKLAKAAGSVDFAAAAKQYGLEEGIAINPQNENSFTGMDIRSHSYEFQMVPTSSAENDSIQKIIEKLQDAMHPLGNGPADAILSYPVQFQIKFYDADGKLLKHIMQVPDCYLDSLGVVYNPIGSGRLMEDGRPTSYRLSLSFKESRALSRDDIRRLR